MGGVLAFVRGGGGTDKTRCELSSTALALRSEQTRGNKGGREDKEEQRMEMSGERTAEASERGTCSKQWRRRWTRENSESEEGLAKIQLEV